MAMELVAILSSQIIFRMLEGGEKCELKSLHCFSEPVRQNPIRRAASVGTKMSTACLQLCLHSAVLPFGGLALRTCLYLSDLKCKWVKVYLEFWGSLRILEMLSYGSFRKPETFKNTKNHNRLSSLWGLKKQINSSHWKCTYPFK